MSESFRLTFLLLSFLCGSFAYSQDTWKNKPYEATLPLYDGERSLGEVKAMIEGETVQWIDRDSLIQALAPHLSSDTLAQLQKLEPTISLASMPLPMHFNVSELRLDMTLKMEQRSRDKLNLQEDYQTRYEGQAVRPAPFGGAINYRLEQNWAAQQNNYKYFSGQFDTFLNMNSVVLESQSYYQSNNDQKWFRGDTRLVKDWEKKQIRFQIGDIYPQVQGFMSPRPMGGLNISRNFALNPYRPV